MRPGPTAPNETKEAPSMQLGMVGLGRMGANLSRRLMAHGHEVVVYDVNAAAVDQLESEGASSARSLEEFAAKLSKPRAAWVMVPAGVAGQTVRAVAGLMDPGDIVIDGGNTYYHDDIERARELGEKGLHYVDVGTSGGVFGLRRGFCLMIGGEPEVVRRLDPIFAALAPGVEAAPRTQGREDQPARSTAEAGYLHCGPTGAGHLVKMVHNGIEYGLMAAYAEGLSILKHANVGTLPQETDAETAPLLHPEYYSYDFDLAEVVEVWRRGSVIASWLLDLTAAAILKSPRLEDLSGEVTESGGGRAALPAALGRRGTAPILFTVLFP